MGSIEELQKLLAASEHLRLQEKATAEQEKAEVVRLLAASEHLRQQEKTESDRILAEEKTNRQRVETELEQERSNRYGVESELEQLRASVISAMDVLSDREYVVSKMSCRETFRQHHHYHDLY
jgi:hypothetical protein